MVRLTLLLLSLCLLLPATELYGRSRRGKKAYGRHHFGFSFGHGDRGHHRHCRHAGTSLPPFYGRHYSHYSALNTWCMHCLIRRWGRWRDVCPKCGLSLFIRNERPYCPRCYLSFRFRRCRLCSALVFVGVPAYVDGPRRYKEKRPEERPRSYENSAQRDNERLSEGRQKLYLKWMDLGLAQLRAARYKDSAGAFLQAMNENPNCQVSQFYWGLALGASGQTYRAGTIIDGAIKKSPLLLRTPLSGAALFGSQERYLKVVKLAKERRKRRAERVFLLVVLKMSNRYEKAAKKLEQQLF